MKPYIVIAMLLASTMPASARSWATFKCGQAIVIYGYAKNYDKNDKRYFTHYIEFYNLKSETIRSFTWKREPDGNGATPYLNGKRCELVPQDKEQELIDKYKG